MTLSELLERVRDRISDPRHHCRRLPSCDVSGNYVHPRDPKAHQWSLLGAVGMESEGHLDIHRAAVWLIADLVRAKGGQSVSRWEDHPDTSYGDVMDLLEESILFAKR